MQRDGFAEVAARANGRWRSILSGMLPLGRKTLNGKNGPCPMCGGKDRWRFTDLNGEGRWWCNACGCGDAFDLIVAVAGVDKREALRMVKRELGEKEHPANDARAPLADDERRAMLIRLWKASTAIATGDAVDRYLTARWLGRPAGEYPADLRFCAECDVSGVPGVKTLPAMVALVRGPDGKGATLHRTYLGPDGRKARIESPKRVMPGPIVEGSAVRLAEPAEGVLGIAEGIETALAAMALWRLPTWAALNSGMLTKWRPPEGVKRVAIMADNDRSYAGHAAAYALAHRLATLPDGPAVEVLVPPTEGFDWADEWARTCREDKARAGQ